MKNHSFILLLENLSTKLKNIKNTLIKSPKRHGNQYAVWFALVRLCVKRLKIKLSPVQVLSQ